MSRSPIPAAAAAARRGVAAAGGAAGCSYLDDLFESDKPPLPGKREAVMVTTRGMQVDASFNRTVTCRRRW